MKFCKTIIFSSYLSCELLRPDDEFYYHLNKCMMHDWLLNFYQSVTYLLNVRKCNDWDIIRDIILGILVVILNVDY